MGDDGKCVYFVMGCMDKKANNFNKFATKADKSCVYEIMGCMDCKANNHNKKATKDDGSCTWYLGCTDPKATNFDSSATKDNGTCKMAFIKPVKAKCWLTALAGCFHPKTSSTRTKEVASTCQLT